MMSSEEEDVLIAASCLMLSCASQLSAALAQKSHRKHSVWIRDYLRQHFLIFAVLHQRLYSIE